MATRVPVWLTPLCLGVFLIFLVQFSQSTIIGADGHLHGRLALEISQQGFLKRLPQAHFSWFTSRFSDKDFVYHLFLMPGVLLFGYETGTKIGAFTASAALVYTVIYLLKLYAHSDWMAWSGLTLFLSAQYLRDTAEPRPLIFAILLTLLGIHALIKKNSILLLGITFLYGLVHMSAWLIPLLAITFAASEWMGRGRIELKSVGVSLLGWVASFLLHPNFPTNLYYFYLNGILVPFYAVKTGVLELGAEFFPLYTNEVLRSFPILLFGVLILLLVRFYTERKLTRETGLWGIAVIVFLPMAFVAKRNMTHLYPIAIIFFSLALAESLDDIHAQSRAFFERLLGILGTLGTLTALYALWQTSAALPLSLFSERVYAEHFGYVADALKRSVPGGERIFHTNWSDSQYLIGLAPEYEYLVTLDPIYMYSFNKDLYMEYRTVSFGKSDDPFTALTKDFGTKYVYAGKNYFTGLIDQLRRDRRFTILGEDELGVVFSAN